MLAATADLLRLLATSSPAIGQRAIPISQNANFRVANMNNAGFFVPAAGVAGVLGSTTSQPGVSYSLIAKSH